MKKNNSNWYYCNTCERPMRIKEVDGLCINCHLYLCLESDCHRCLDINEIVDLLILEQRNRKSSEEI